MTRHGQPRADAQLPERLPPVVRQEGVVGRGTDGLARGEAEAEDLARARREDLREVPPYITERGVERPHRHVASTGGEQGPKRHLGTGVGAQDAGRRRQAAAFAKVGQHRLLVGALLRATVEL